MSVTATTLTGAQKRLRTSKFMIAICVLALFAMVLAYAFLPSQEAGISKYAPFLVVIFNLGLGFLVRSKALADFRAETSGAPS